ncbi:gas vesicle protein GvpJ [Streptosporangium carneum]|uniref:Gas vesicle protein A n=1 Tax=Streptosporangium carneum TaxID=47481 RepID=A0A9W6MAH8_9ACTN|nr:gas vesicle protein GvpJ [Streptosporangium carneum]GLK07017.1 putative gas vesicle structural protein 1 [Streptosporangium carneum]
MTIVQPSGGGAAGRGGSSSSGLADVIDTILDKGLVIDAFVRVSLVGIELVTIDVRVVVASVDTYLRFAEAANRLDLTQTGGKGLPEVVQDMTQGVGSAKTKGIAQGAIEAAGEKLQEFLGGSDEEYEERRPAPRRRRRREEE